MVIANIKRRRRRRRTAAAAFLVFVVGVLVTGLAVGKHTDIVAVTGRAECHLHRDNELR